MDSVESAIWHDEATRQIARRQKAAMDAACSPYWEKEALAAEQKRLVKLMSPAKEDGGEGNADAQARAQEAEWLRNRQRLPGLIGRKQR